MSSHGWPRATLALALVGLVALLALAAGCASNGGDAGDAPPDESAYEPPPPGSPLAKVEVGMTDVQVRTTLGEPDYANAYPTWKQFMPWYYGSDTSRTDWMYKGMGRVVFSRNRYSGGLKVVRVLYNPDELQQ